MSDGIHEKRRRAGRRSVVIGWAGLLGVGLMALPATVQGSPVAPAGECAEARPSQGKGGGELLILPPVSEGIPTSLRPPPVEGVPPTTEGPSEEESSVPPELSATQSVPSIAGPARGRFNPIDVAGAPVPPLLDRPGVSTLATRGPCETPGSGCSGRLQPRFEEPRELSEPNFLPE
jgi:hypothetical protein